MWHWTHKATFSGLTKAEVFSAWAEVERWSEWDEGIDYARLAGPFQPGAKITLRPKGGPEVSINVLSADPELGFTDETRFFLARMVDVHEMRDTPEGLELTSTLSMHGPLAALWVRLVGAGVASSVPEQMSALCRYIVGRRRHAA
jgi:hypothetical protein